MQIVYYAYKPVFTSSTCLLGHHTVVLINNLELVSGNFFDRLPLTKYITDAIWTDEASNILYENASVGLYNFWSPGIKFVYLLSIGSGDCEFATLPLMI